MAKVDSIELNIEGEKKSFNINVRKDGIFRCKLDKDTAHYLSLDPFERSANTLQELKDEIDKAYKIYCDNTEIEKIFIAIEFKASEPFNRDPEGNIIFRRGDKFYEELHFDNLPTIGFRFRAYILHQRGGVDTWYTARKGTPSIRFYTSEECRDPYPGKWYKYEKKYEKPSGVIIDFSDKSYQALQKAEDGLTSISEILYNFLSQEPEQISSMLETGKYLLPEPEETA